MAVRKKYATLGRGLDALISTDDVQTKGSSSINEIPTNKIVANPNQPRREFDEDALQELADSIRQLGIVQPVTLRQTTDEMYQIIAGERRWRAAQLADLETIPAYVRTADDENVMQMALVENIQREDLNALEIALAYQNLMEQFKLTQEELSRKVGKKRTTVTNYLRLLKLPAPVQVALQRKEIDQGHARALLGLESPSQQIRLFREIQKEGYSVRKVEELVREWNESDGKNPVKQAPGKQEKTPAAFGLLTERLSEVFQTKVNLRCSPAGKGKISIAFSSEEELANIIGLLDKIHP